MTPEEQRIAIAEACGWRKGQANVNCDHSKADGYWFGGKFYIGTEHIPDYLNDLNAIHEAEKLLNTMELQNRYYSEIASICWEDEERGDNQVVFNQLTSSATQRSEAFLKALNLYEKH